MNKIKNGFDRMSEAVLLVEATSIVIKCTGNTYFTAEQAVVTQLDAAAEAYGEALDLASSGDRLAIATKDARKTVLINLLRKLGDLVSAVAGGNRMILVSSGYPLVKDREPAPPLTKPNPPALSAGFMPGQIVSEGASERSAKAVQHMFYCRSPNGPQPMEQHGNHQPQVRFR